jgi:hypothetical protein
MVSEVVGDLTKSARLVKTAAIMLLDDREQDAVHPELKHGHSLTVVHPDRDGEKKVKGDVLKVNETTKRVVWNSADGFVS